MSKFEVSYNISTDSGFRDKENGITAELSAKLENYHHLAMEGKRSSIKKLKDAIEKHPKNPQLKNFLSVLYGNLDENQKMFDVNKWITKEHPDYLFGKLNLANEYYLKEEYDKIPEVLGEKMELKSLYPHRDTFHISEVTSFFKCTILYFCAIGDLEQAEKRLEFIYDIAPDAFDTEATISHVEYALATAAKKRYEEERKSKTLVKTKPQQTSTENKAPSFNHQEIKWLYTNGLYISEDKINTLLSLPKETLIQDLELVLQDSINRYSYFLTLAHEDEWDEEKMNFVVHSMFLLAELKSTQSIDAIFNVLSQSEEYLELYLGDFLTTFIWEILYNIISNDLEKCKSFMYKPGLYTFSKICVPDMIEQVALLHPERRDEVINWFKDVIQFFLNSSLEDNVLDSDVIALLICNIINIKGIELLPDIKKLYDRDLVSEGICGNWDNLNKEIVEPEDYDRRREILSITEQYKNITSTWSGYNEKETNWNFEENYFEPETTTVRLGPKIGRNDPCPCGSGKKYKKCCLN